MEWITYILYGILAFIVILTASLTIKKMVLKKREKADSKSREVEDVVVKNNTRYTPDAEIVDKDGNMNLSYVKNDIVLQPRKVVVVDKKGQIKPGKYTVLSAYENEETFNIRIGLYVKEYKHGQEIVLVQGDEICRTSSAIILR